MDGKLLFSTNICAITRIILKAMYSSGAVSPGLTQGGGGGVGLKGIQSLIEMSPQDISTLMQCENACWAFTMLL